MTNQYMSKTQVAEHLGLADRTLSGYAHVLPEPDARIGNIVGWTRTTIDSWWAERPKRPARRLANQKH